MGFTYHQPIAISAISPAVVGEAGGDVVTVSGANFADNGALACKFGASQLVRALWQSPSCGAGRFRRRRPRCRAVSSSSTCRRR